MPYLNYFTPPSLRRYVVDHAPECAGLYDTTAEKVRGSDPRTMMSWMYNSMLRRLGLDEKGNKLFYAIQDRKQLAQDVEYASRLTGYPVKVVN